LNGAEYYFRSGHRKAAFEKQTGKHLDNQQSKQISETGGESDVRLQSLLHSLRVSSQGEALK